MAEGGGATAFQLRDQPVMLAADIALIFGVETREIVQNIKSNPDMFPERYAFELRAGEVDQLRSAGLISKPGRGGSRERKALENVRVRIAVAQEMIAMYQKLEPNALVQLTTSFATAAVPLRAQHPPALEDRSKS